MDFRRILKTKPRGLNPQDCKSKSSPTCLLNFIKTRKEQTMCFNCLVFNGLLEAHPVLNFENPERGSKRTSRRTR